ncbi:MAG: GNAT family N-acetyltransferase [Acidimicrobiales bacterium]
MVGPELDESARLATPDDVAAISLLVQDALGSITDSRGGELWTLHNARSVPAEDSVADAVGDDQQLVVVGTLDGSIVGYAMAQLARLPDETDLAVLSDLFVLAEARQVGVGEAIIDLVLRWATGRACRGIDSAALPGDRHTKNFFESNGLVARAITVHKRL